MDVAEANATNRMSLSLTIQKLQEVEHGCVRFGTRVYRGFMHAYKLVNRHISGARNPLY